MNSPRVSVVIPTYNRKRYVAEAVDSVLAQTFTDFEVLVIDDGSTDGTAEMMAERFGNEPRVRHIWQENAERAAARNHGIHAAKGELIAFLDSDDLWLPTKLEKQVKLFDADPSLVLVHAGYSQIDDSGAVFSTVVYAPQNGRVQGTMFRQMLRANRISPDMAVVRRSVFERTGVFNEDRRLICFEDWDMWTRICHAGPVGYIPEVLALRRLHPGNTEKPVTIEVYQLFLNSVCARINRVEIPSVRFGAARAYRTLLVRAPNFRERWRASLCMLAVAVYWGPRFLVSKVLAAIRCRT